MVDTSIGSQIRVIRVKILMSNSEHDKLILGAVLKTLKKARINELRYVNLRHDRSKGKDN